VKRDVPEVQAHIDVPDIEMSVARTPSKHNLPDQLTSFIGRDREISEINALFAGTRLLTLTGAGASDSTAGKSSTSLAKHRARASGIGQDQTRPRRSAAAADPAIINGEAARRNTKTLGVRLPDTIAAWSLTRRNLLLCVRNDGYEASLERRKIYQALPDREATKHRQVRVIDESGEDYPYPATPAARADPQMRGHPCMRQSVGHGGVSRACRDQGDVRS